MHKYQYTSNYKFISLFKKSIAGLNYALKNTYKDVFSMSSIDFDGNRMFYKLYFHDNKDIIMELEWIPEGYKLVVIDKKTKEKIHTMIFNHTNYNELDTVTIFLKRVMPTILSIVK